MRLTRATVGVYEMSRSWNDYYSTGSTAVTGEGRSLSSHMGKEHFWNNIIVANNANRTIFSQYLNQTISWSGGYLGSGHTKVTEFKIAIPPHWNNGQTMHNIGLTVASKAASGSPPSDGCRLDMYTQSITDDQHLLGSYTLSNSSTANYVNLGFWEYHPDLVNIEGNYFYLVSLMFDAVLAGSGYTYVIGNLGIFFADEDELE